MKNLTVAKKILLIVFGALLGLVLLGSFAMLSVRNSIMQERQQSIKLLTTLAGKQIEHFQALEKSGKLTREQAQTAAKEAMHSLHNGDDFVFVRTGDKLLMTLVHPDPRKEGIENNGGIQPNGQALTDLYVEALKKDNFAFVSVMAKRPNSDAVIPKISALFLSLV